MKPYPGHVLRRGSTGTAVEAIQYELRNLDVDGIYGVKTEAAVRSFQAKHGLDVDGIVGPRTWAKLFGDPTPAKPSGAAKVAAPLEHILADSWGWHPGVHDGIDLICPPNEPLHAICKAKVIRADAGGWWGKGAPADPVLRAKGDGIIIIRSLIDAGPILRGMNLCYGHAEGAVVKAGQTVEAGQHIGHAGFANAWHTHFMVNMRGLGLGLGDRDPKPVVDYARSHDFQKVTR